MAKKRQPAKIEPYEFDDLHRGTSYCFPIIVNKSDGTPYDLTGYSAIFTLKKMQSDFDYDDDRALITKEFTPCTDPERLNRIDIVLTSKELWLEPGQYYFDIVLMHGYASKRILLATTNLVGGPTNHNVRHEQKQDDFFMMDPLEITPKDDGKFVVVQVPLITDPPDNLVETASGDPDYIYEPIGDPVRDIRYRVYGPRLSLMMTFKVAHDHTPHRVRFDEFFLRENIPAPCPLKDGHIEINNRKVTLKLAKEMDMVWTNTCIQHNPEITYDGGHGEQKSTEPLYMGDRTDSGHLYIHLQRDNDQISFDAHHFIPDDHYGFELWMIRIDWFNWIDPYEPDPEKPDVATHYPDGCPVADTWEGYWPPEIHYTQDDTQYAKDKKRARTCAERSVTNG